MKGSIIFIFYTLVQILAASQATESERLQAAKSLSVEMQPLQAIMDVAIPFHHPKFLEKRKEFELLVRGLQKDLLLNLEPRSLIRNRLVARSNDVCTLTDDQARRIQGITKKWSDDKLLPFMQDTRVNPDTLRKGLSALQRLAPRDLRKREKAPDELAQQINRALAKRMEDERAYTVPVADSAGTSSSSIAVVESHKSLSQEPSKLIPIKNMDEWKMSLQDMKEQVSFKELTLTSLQRSMNLPAGHESLAGLQKGLEEAKQAYEESLKQFDSETRRLAGQPRHVSPARSPAGPLERPNPFRGVSTHEITPASDSNARRLNLGKSGPPANAPLGSDSKWFPIISHTNEPRPPASEPRVLPIKEDTFLIRFLTNYPLLIISRKVGNLPSEGFPKINMVPDADLTKPLNAKPMDGAPIYPKVKNPSGPTWPSPPIADTPPKEAPKATPVAKSSWQRMVQSWRAYWKKNLGHWKAKKEKAGIIGVEKEPYPFSRDENGNPRGWKSAQDAENQQRMMAEMNRAAARQKEVDQWRADMQRYNEAVKKWRAKSGVPPLFPQYHLRLRSTTTFVSLQLIDY